MRNTLWLDGWHTPTDSGLPYGILGCHPPSWKEWEQRHARNFTRRKLLKTLLLPLLPFCLFGHCSWIYEVVCSTIWIGSFGIIQHYRNNLIFERNRKSHIQYHCDISMYIQCESVSWNLVNWKAVVIVREMIWQNQLYFQVRYSHLTNCATNNFSFLLTIFEPTSSY